MTQEEIDDKIIESDLFEGHQYFVKKDNLVYRLVGTNYLFFPLNYAGPVWFREFIRYDNRCTFEQVFESVPLEIQEKLLFNLDLFR